jgi:hypothetical protein
MSLCSKTSDLTNEREVPEAMKEDAPQYLSVTTTEQLSKWACFRGWFKFDARDSGTRSRSSEPLPELVDDLPIVIADERVLSNRSFGTSSTGSAQKRRS